MQGFPPYNRIISKRMKQQISDGGKLKMKKLVIAAALVLILATGATAMAAGTVPVLRKAATASAVWHHHSDHARHHINRSSCAFVDSDGDGICDNCNWGTDCHGRVCGTPAWGSGVTGYYGNTNAAQGTSGTSAEFPVETQSDPGQQPAVTQQEVPAEPQTPVSQVPVVEPQAPVADVQPVVEPPVESQPVVEPPAAPVDTYYNSNAVPQNNECYYGNDGYGSGYYGNGCGNYNSGHHGSGHHGRGHH